MDGEGERREDAGGEAAREATRLEAQDRIGLFPGCEGVRVEGDQGEWRAVMTISADDPAGGPAREADDILVRRPTLALLVDFFERHGGYARET